MPGLRVLSLASFLLGPVHKNTGDFKADENYVPGLKPGLRLLSLASFLPGRLWPERRNSLSNRYPKERSMGIMAMIRSTLTIELRGSNDPVTVALNSVAQRFQLDQLDFTLRAEDFGFPAMQPWLTTQAFPAAFRRPFGDCPFVHKSPVGGVRRWSRGCQQVVPVRLGTAVLQRPDQAV